MIIFHPKRKDCTEKNIPLNLELGVIVLKSAYLFCDF